MNNKPKITQIQLVLMAVGSALVFPFTFLPILNAPPSNQDMWIVLLMALVYMMVINAPLLLLVIFMRGYTFNEMIEALMGRVLGKALTIPFVLFFIYCYSACMLITVQFLNIYLLQDAPTWALAILIGAASAYAAFKGAGTIARLSTLIVPAAILTTLFFFLIGMPKMDISVLKPILADSTFAQLNQGAFLTASRFSEILIIGVFSFFMNKKYSIAKAFFLSLGLFGTSFLLILIPTMLVLGPELAKNMWSPYYGYASQESLNFLQRVQAINIIVWFPMAILKLMIYNYMGSFVFSGVVNTKKTLLLCGPYRCDCSYHLLAAICGPNHYDANAALRPSLSLDRSSDNAGASVNHFGCLRNSQKEASSQTAGRTGWE